VLLSKRNRIGLSMSADQWIERGLTAVGIECLPLNERILVLSASLPEHHRDPADRMIIATAIEHGAELISLDAAFTDYATSSGLYSSHEIYPLPGSPDLAPFPATSSIVLPSHPGCGIMPQDH